MFTIYLLPLLLFFIGSIRADNVSSFPDSLYPQELSLKEFRSQCSFEFNKFDICQVNYQDCFGTLKSVDTCNHAFCGCIKKETDYDYSENWAEVSLCTNYTNDACYMVHRNGGIFKKTILQKMNEPVVKKIGKRLDKVNVAMSSVAKSCMNAQKWNRVMDSLKNQLNSSNELLNLTLLRLLALPGVESLMMTNLKGCKAAVERLEETLEQEDQTSASHLNLPYEFSHIGTEFGAPFKIAMRTIGDEACEKATINFNHNAIIWVNCYDQQKPKEECDRKYLQGNEKILKSMDSKKAACGMFVDLIKTVLPVRSMEFYREAANYYVESSHMRLGGKMDRAFGGFLNGNITGRDTKNTILNLDASETTSRRVVNNYENILLKCSATRRSAGVVSYCGYLYGYCTKFVKSNCDIQFAVCLDGIEQMDDACKNAVKTGVNLLWKTDPPKFVSSTPDSSDTLQENGYSWSWITLIPIAFGVILLGLLICLTGWFVFKRFQGPAKSLTDSNNQSVSQDLGHEKNVENEPLIFKTPIVNVENGNNEQPHGVPVLAAAPGNNQENNEVVARNESMKYEANSHPLE